MEEEIIIIESEEEQEIVVTEPEIEYIAPTTQEKTITPKKEQQIVVPDDGVFALSKVTVEEIPSEYVEVAGTLDITTNGEYDVKQYEKANVNIGGLEITDASYLFYGGARMDVLNELCSMISSNCKEFYAMFYTNNQITEVPTFNTSGATNFNSMFRGCFYLTKVPEIDASNVISADRIFMSSSALTTFGGLKNLGKAYITTASANNSSYKLDLSSCRLLTYDSLMNVINNLWDIASDGCETQSLVLGATNIAKLTEEEIAIAQTKGFTVS